jgi:hypothetical protein
MTGLRAAVTLGLTGRYAVQARQARSGLELWAEDDHVDLHVHDDAVRLARLGRVELELSRNQEVMPWGLP